MKPASLSLSLAVAGTQTPAPPFDTAIPAQIHAWPVLMHERILGRQTQIATHARVH